MQHGAKLVAINVCPDSGLVDFYFEGQANPDPWLARDFAPLSETRGKLQAIQSLITEFNKKGVN